MRSLKQLQEKSLETILWDMCPTLFFIVVCLLVPSEGKEHYCPEPPQKIHTKRFETDCVVKNDCRVNQSLRYQCEDGYRRAAGTSNLIICKQVDNQLKWDEKEDTKLRCIHIATPPHFTCRGPPTISPTISPSTNPTVSPSEFPEGGWPEPDTPTPLSSQFLTQAAPLSQTTPTPTMPLSKPTERGRPESTSTSLSPESVAQTQGPVGETEASDLPVTCDTTTAPEDTPISSTGKPSGQYSTEEKVSIGSGIGVLIMVIAGGVGMYLYRNRGISSPAHLMDTTLLPGWVLTGLAVL